MGLGAAMVGLKAVLAAIALLILARILQLRHRRRDRRRALQVLAEVVYHMWWEYEVPRDVREDHEMQRHGML